MSRDILDDQGTRSASRHPAAAFTSSPPPPDKLSSLLEYLDTVSAQSEQRHYGFDSPKAVSQHDAHDSCSTTSSPGRRVRLQHEVSGSRRRQRKRSSLQDPIDSSRETPGRREGGWSQSPRAPWNITIKSKAPARVVQSSQEGTDPCVRRGQRRSIKETTCASTVDCSTISRHDAIGEQAHSKDTSDVHVRGDDKADVLSTTEYKRRIQAQGTSQADNSCSDEASEPDGTAGTTEAGRLEVSMIGGGRRRWIWDEWDLHDLVNAPTEREGVERNDDTIVGASSCVNSTSAERHFDNVCPQREAIHERSWMCGRQWQSPSNVRFTNATARQAFDDIQATAREMCEDLRVKRSEVLDLKLSLQRVRASNERRHEKLLERWASKAEAAAAEKRATAEHQRTFTIKLKKDVEDLEERLDAMERQVCRFHDGRERNCALARAECARNLKKAREEWMRAEKGRLRETTDKKAGAMKQAAARALEPQLAELVKSNRVEARAHAEDLETALLGLQATLERESTEQVQDEVKEFQHILEAEAEEERRQAEHQLKLVARSNEADVQEFREAVRRDLEDERVRFEAVRKRARVAAAKEIETVRAAEADRAGITLAENARELREAEEAYRKEEDETRRRLAQETDRWQRRGGASARKNAEERGEIRKREAREKCNEDLEMVLTRLEDEASQNREAVRATAERATTAAAEERARALNAAQELETKAMERYLEAARRQADIESGTTQLEQEIKAAEERIQHEMDRLATAEQQARERHERWRSRLDRMHEECLEERKAARADVSRLEDRAEEVEALARTVAREAEEEQAALRVSLTVEFNQVEEKVAVVLKKKMEQANALRERLATLQAQTKAREEELSDHRRRAFS